MPFDLGFQSINASKIGIVLGTGCKEPESRAAQILQSRILKRSRIESMIVSEDNPEGVTEWADVIFSVGTPETNSLSSRLMCELKAELPKLPDCGEKHPEGFIVKSGPIENRNYVLIAGCDERGTLYGVGMLLRSLAYWPDRIEVPALEARERPAFPVRGGSVRGVSSLVNRFGDVRPQTEGELGEMLEDLLLIGVNVIQGDPDLVRPYGIMTSTTGSRRTANDIPRFPDGRREVEEEWAADFGTNRRLICPSVPEARRATLETIEEIFRKEPHHDYFFIKSGDPGGCHCPRCRPWGRTCIKLIRDISAILHSHHPDCKVIATIQDMENEDSQALLDYLNENDSSWLHAISYGPGSDEMQTYYRGPVNPRWFEYEGFGPTGNYLKHLHHELPGGIQIILFTDLTHWINSQYGVSSPDPALTAVFGRRTWNARPRRFHQVGREILHYASGDIPYNEGMHGDFNKWFWNRMLWNPHQTAEHLTSEYCRYWFGPEAEEEMAEAIFLMEETLEKPVLGNGNIPRALELIRSAGKKIPQNLKVQDYRWRIIAQKALIDRYTQLGLARGEKLKELARPMLEEARTSVAPGRAIEKALRILNLPKITDQMKEILDEAMALGEESNHIVGYRAPACLTVNDLDLTEIGWWVKILNEGLSTLNEEEMVNAVNMVLEYENPGPGGFYDRVGLFDRPGTLICSGLRWMLYPFSGPARLSHYGLAYPDPLEGDSITFAYKGLVEGEQYTLRALVRGHRLGSRPEEEKGEVGVSVEVNGRTIAGELEVTGTLSFLEVDVPRELTDLGDVKISLVTGPDPTATGKGRMMAGLCNIWLMKKGEMSWTAPRLSAKR